jgi:hypothetical protein
MECGIKYLLTKLKPWEEYFSIGAVHMIVREEMIVVFVLIQPKKKGEGQIQVLWKSN